MVNIIKEEIEIEESLESRLRVICDFCNTTPTIINGSIRRIDKTNLTYIEPHRIYIKNNLYLAFNYSSEIYVNNLGKKIKLSESKETIKILQESNNALELRNTKLKEENNKLKSRNSSLENELKNLKEIFEIFKNKLERLYHFFVDKIWEDKEKRDKYYPVAYELYGKNILDEEQIRGILETKQRSAKIDNESKSRDDDMEL